MRLKVAGGAGAASVQRANAGQESRGRCLALTGNVGWVGCDGCMAAAVGAWGWGNLGSGLGRLDDSSFSWAGRASLSRLDGNHIGVEAHGSGGGSSLNGPLDLSYTINLTSTYHCDGFLLSDGDGGLTTATLAASVTASAGSGSSGTSASSRRSSNDSDSRGRSRGAEDSGRGFPSNLLVATGGLYLLASSLLLGEKIYNIQQ